MLLLHKTMAVSYTHLIAHDHGITTIGITGYMDSPLTQTCDYNIDIGCGDEPIGPKTKGYMAT